MFRDGQSRKAVPASAGARSMPTSIARRMEESPGVGRGGSFVARSNLMGLVRLGLHALNARCTRLRFRLARRLGLRGY
jgi:hypothetical protein